MDVNRPGPNVGADYISKYLPFAITISISIFGRDLGIKRLQGPLMKALQSINFSFY